MTGQCSPYGGGWNGGPCGPAPCTGECRSPDGDDACIGACGKPGCPREDCRVCDACRDYFDRDLEGSTCDTYGDRCEACGPVRCSGDCCYSGPDTWAEYWGEK